MSFVDRPQRQFRPGKFIDYDLLVQTASNGKAVSVTLNGHPPAAVRHALSAFLRRRGMSLRTERGDGVLLCWAIMGTQ